MTNKKASNGNSNSKGNGGSEDFTANFGGLTSGKLEHYL